MTTPSKLYGLSAVAQAAICGDQTTGISAAGTTQATATALTTDLNVLSTVTAASGVILPVGEVGKSVTVRNDGANAVLVYPPVGGTINGFATNAGFTIGTKQAATFSYSTTLASTTTGGADSSALTITGKSTNSTTSTTPTYTAVNISGGRRQFLFLTGAAGGGVTGTLPLVTDLVAAIPNAYPGLSYELRIINTTGQTVTVTTNTGWTLTGTMTIANNTTRDFEVALTSLTAATLTQCGVGTTS